MHPYVQYIGFICSNNRDIPHDINRSQTVDKWGIHPVSIPKNHFKGKLALDTFFRDNHLSAHVSPYNLPTTSP